MEKIYKVLRYNDARNVSFAEFQLEGLAYNWWRVIDEKWRNKGRQPEWGAFVTEFRNKFILKVTRDRKEQEFLYLRQRNLTVPEYKAQFTKLATYARDMENTEEKRVKRFTQGLNLEIQRPLLAARLETYAEVVEFAQKTEDLELKWKDFRSNRGDSRGQASQQERSTQEEARASQKSFS